MEEGLGREPDGVLIMTDSGITKVIFEELPPEQ